MKTVQCNIKGIPEGVEFLTRKGFSECYPFKVVRRTKSTLFVKPVKVKPDPDWHPEIIPGGFVGHCTNAGSQTWLYDGVEESAEATPIRIGAKTTFNNWREGARYTYDYNF